MSDAQIITLTLSVSEAQLLARQCNEEAARQAKAGYTASAIRWLHLSRELHLPSNQPPPPPPGRP